jgi:hypothetical protein
MTPDETSSARGEHRNLDRLTATYDDAPFRTQLLVDVTGDPSLRDAPTAVEHKLRSVIDAVRNDVIQA